MSLSKMVVTAIGIVMLSATVSIYSEKYPPTKNKPVEKQQDTTGYTSLWKTVDSLADKGLTR